MSIKARRSMAIIIGIDPYGSTWRFPKMGLPRVTLGFDTCEWSKKMDDLGSPYDLGHFHI